MHYSKILINVLKGWIQKTHAQKYHAHIGIGVKNKKREQTLNNKKRNI